MSGFNGTLARMCQIVISIYVMSSRAAGHYEGSKLEEVPYFAEELFIRSPEEQHQQKKVKQNTSTVCDAKGD